MVGRQRQVIGVAVLSLLIVFGIAALAAGGNDGERIVADAGVLARAGLTTVVEAPATVAAPTTTGTAYPTTLGPPATTTAPAPTTAARATVATSTTAPAPVAAAASTAAPTTTTTAGATTTTAGATTTTVAPTTTTTVAPTTTTTVAPTTTTTVDPCRNSTDPQCGPFRFDPQPGADNPMTVQVAVEPASPVAGQPMVFHITLTDPDGVSYDGTNFNFGNSGIGGSTPEPCAKFGPWDPPALDPASAVETTDVTHTYFEPGSYTATFVFDAGPFDCVDSVTGRGDRPYASTATGTVTVVVAPSP